MSPLARVGVAVVVLALTGCTLSARTGYFNDRVAGADVERVIDEQLAPNVPLLDPGFKVAPAHCPELLDVSQGRTEFCTMRVEGVDLPVTVTGRKEQFGFLVETDAVVVKMHRIASDVADDIDANYGVRPRVDCGGPEVRVEFPNTPVTCSLLGTLAGHVDVESDKLGRISVKAVPKQRPRRFEVYLAQHKAGLRTVVPGSALGAYLADVYRIRTRRGPRLRDYRGVRCPDRADLSGAKRAICRIDSANGAPRYAISLDNAAGIRAIPLDAIVDTHAVRILALTSMRSRLAAAGLHTSLSVDCGADRVVVAQPKSTFGCDVSAPDYKSRLIVTVVNANGLFNMRVLKTNS
jgi:hypothetical protein